MVAKLIDGKSFAVQIRSEIATQVKGLLGSVLFLVRNLRFVEKKKT